MVLIRYQGIFGTFQDVGLYLNLPKPTFCRVPINSILGFILRTCKKGTWVLSSTITRRCFVRPGLGCLRLTALDKNVGG